MIHSTTKHPRTQSSHHCPHFTDEAWGGKQPGPRGSTAPRVAEPEQGLVCYGRSREPSPRHGLDLASRLQETRRQGRERWEMWAQTQQGRAREEAGDLRGRGSEAGSPAGEDRTGAGKEVERGPRNLRVCSRHPSSGVKAAWVRPPRGPLSSWATLGKSLLTLGASTVVLSKMGERAVQSLLHRPWGYGGGGAGGGHAALSHGLSDPARRVSLGQRWRPDTCPPRTRSMQHAGRGSRGTCLPGRQGGRGTPCIFLEEKCQRRPSLTFRRS